MCQKNPKSVITLSLSPVLKQLLQERAKREHRSTSAELRVILEQEFAEELTKKKVIK